MNTQSTGVMTHRGPWLHVCVACMVALAYFGFFLHALGVDVSDSIRYGLYFGLVILAPGVLLAQAVWRRKMGALRMICLGAALGYVLEGFVFLGLGPLRARGLWKWYPAVGILACVRLAWHWREARRHAPVVVDDTLGAIWTKTIVIGLIITVYSTFLAYLSSVSSHVALMPVSPDQFLHLGTAAEIMQHWPVTDPRLAGFGFSYHYLAHVHVAAASLITGIDLQVLLFRLYLVPLLVLAALNTCVLTRTFTRSVVVDLLALVIVFFSGTADVSFFSESVVKQLWHGGVPLVDLGDPWAFVGNSFFSGSSPSLVYGTVIFLPLVSETLAATTEGLDSWRRIAVLSLLMAGSMLAKGSFMPVFFVGMLLATLWLRLLRDDKWRRAFWVTALSVAVCVPLYLTFYYPHFQGEGTPSISPFAIVKYTELWGRFEPVLRSLWQAGAVRGSVDWTFRAIALLTASMVVVIYLCVSFGTRILGMGFYVRRHGVRMPSGALVVTCIVVGSLAPTYLLSMIDGNQLHFLNSGYPLAGIMGAAGLGHLIFRKRTSAPQRIAQVLAVAMLVVSTWNSAYAFAVTYRNRNVATAVTSIPIVYENSDSYAAQRWIRDHTSSMSVLAVSIFAGDDEQFKRRCDYSAFSERRLFLEGYHYQRPRDPQELTSRRALLTAVFRKGEASALKTLNERFGVTHLVVDTSDGLPVKLPDQGLTLVFQTETVRVYGVESGRDRGSAHPIVSDRSRPSRADLV